MPETPSPDEASVRGARERQQTLTKPPGSLGALEETAVRLAGLQRTARPRSRPCAALLFAADHPVVGHGVSAYPAEVTAAMLRNFERGGAAASVMARSLEVALKVVDVGVHASPVRCNESVVAEDGPVVRDSVADAAAGDLREGAALDHALYERCLRAGRHAVDRWAPGARVIALGEMGIGNTTAAAAVACALLRCEAEEIVGPGTGLDVAGLERKRQIVAEAVAHVRDGDPETVLQSVGGRDIVALIGAMLRAVERRQVVLVDGFVVTAAALAFARSNPEARPWLMFAHRSAEPGHHRMLDTLDARPLLDLGLRLGEGTGALTALPLLDLACATHADMATFGEAEIPGPATP